MSSTEKPIHSTGQNRRQFLKTSSLAIAGAALANTLGWTSQTARAATENAKSGKRLGVALIGCGRQGQRLLQECLRNHEEWQLEFPVVCDVWKPQAKTTADAVETATGRRPRETSRYSDVLAMDEVDCVIIATPDFSHTPILVAAADAGKQIYVEKPMAVSIEQADAAVEAVSRNNTIIQVGTQFRSRAQFAEAARLIAEGELGQILKVDASYHRPRFGWGNHDASVVREEEVDWEQFLMDLPARPFDPHHIRSWQLYRDYTTGITGLIGSHVIDIAHWLTGSGAPTSATGVQAWMIGQESETADFQECLFTHEKGFILNSSCRTGNSAPGSQVNIYGTRGTLHCPYSLNATLRFSPDGVSVDNPAEARALAPKPAPSHLENWFSCIRSETAETYANIHAGYAHSIAAILATESAEERRRLSFPPRKA